MHLAKYKRSSVASLIAHDERTIENHTNEKIDSSRSHLNYSLIERGYDYYQKRLSEVFCINRKDINTVGSLVITLPKEVREEDEEAFFQKSFEYFSKMFGEKNVVSAEVHKDETTDHMHFKFIPVYLQEKEIKRGKDKGKKIQREAVSFDEVCPRELFRSLHKDFQKHIDQELGYHVGVLNGATKGLNTVEALKEYDKLKKENLALKAEKEKLTNQVKEQQATIQQQKQEINQYQDMIRKMKLQYDNLKEHLQTLIEAIQPLERLKSVLHTLWTFPREFMAKADELESEYKLTEEQMYDLDVFYHVAQENDQTLEDVIKLAEEISSNNTSEEVLIPKELER